MEALERYKEAKGRHQLQLNRLPLIATKDLFKAAQNRNETYVLRNLEGRNQWICKFNSNANIHQSVVEAEQAASVVNFHSKFPIPLTVLFDVGGENASLQFFIDGAVRMEDLQQQQLRVNQDDLKKILLFDLIFANEDRHDENILFREFGGEYRAYGIDNDQCMVMRGRGIETAYLPLFDDLGVSFGDVFLDNLISPSQVTEYTDLINKAGFDTSDWINNVVPWINRNPEYLQFMLKY